jgi:MFS transporter, DHA3 family, multidrug efflux protein
MKTFIKLLIYALIAGTTNNFIWFALTFWIYLGTKNVISTAFVGGLYLVATASLGIWFGSLVDHHKKKTVMIGSSATSLVAFSLAFLIYIFTPKEMFGSISNPILWVFALILMIGVVAGNIIAIAIPTLITSLVEAKNRDKANGMFGTVFGISFAITSFASGLILGFFGMFWVLVTAIIFTITALLFISFVTISEKKIIHTGAESKKIDFRGTIKVVGKIPGLYALIFFTTFNNFIGGVFMALMDAYGLSLMSVQLWGAFWGVVSFGFIIGGLFIAKWGLGKNPIKTLFRVNIAIWIMCIIFPVQPSIILLFLGSLTWMTLFPFIEATEQTIVQKVVPQERQGRVFGFAQSIEQAASPLTAFLIGPIAQLFFIPFMTTGFGAKAIGGWFGIGQGRGIALVFISAGIIGLIVTLIAMRSKQYQLLSNRYLRK